MAQTVRLLSGSTVFRQAQALRVFIAVGRPHITLIAALGIFTFGWLFMGRYPWFLTAICALDWYIVNLTNRIVDLREDQANRISGTHFSRHHRQTLLILTLTLLITSLFGVHLVNPAITPLRVAGHLLGILYNWPLIPGRRRLKDLYFWKNTASAMGFMITVFGYPLATMASAPGPMVFPPGIDWRTVAFTAIFFFLFEISYEVIYDLRDVKGDELAGVRTYPVVHGERAACFIVDGLVFSAVAVLAAGYWIDAVPWRIFIMASAPLIQLAVYKRAVRRGIVPADCIRITWLGVSLLLVYHLWVVAGLPGAEF